MIVQDGLNIAKETYRAVSPRRKKHGGGRARRRQWWRGKARDKVARFMASGAAPLFAGLKAEEAPHAPQLHPVLVKQLEINRFVRRDAEVRAAIFFHRHVAQDMNGSPVDQVGTFF